MRKSFFGKLLLTFCIMLGCMTGYGIVRLTGTGGGNIYNIISRTEDNTLDREKDSVFFASDGGNPDLTLMPAENLQVEHTELENVTDLVLPVADREELEKTKELEITVNPTVTPEPLEKAEEMEETETTGQALLVTPIVEQVSDAGESLKNNREEEEKKQEEDGVKTGEKEVSETVAEGIETKEKEVKANEMIVEEIEENQEETNEMETEGIKEQEWKANEIVAKGIKEKIEAEKKEIKTNEMVVQEIEEKLKGTEKEIKANEIVAEGIGEQVDVTFIPEKTESAQVFTYPTEIFGQTPVINRSDEYVTYFEFALDLIETVEPEVKERGLSETALFTKFVVKALFCGVDVKTIKVNAPISRSEAALALWLTAQVMEEKGTDTSATSGVSYVTDLGNCSSSEKKAIAYLYEQGVISGHQIAGQTFLPSKDLKTEDGTAWMTKIKQCWK